MVIDSSACARQYVPTVYIPARQVVATPTTVTRCSDTPRGGLPASNPAETIVPIVPPGGNEPMSAPMPVMIEPEAVGACDPTRIVAPC